MPMLLKVVSDLRRRISTGIPAIKLRRSSPSSSTTVEEPFDKVFKDPVLLNIVADYFFATDAVLEYCECAKRFLEKAQHGERIVDEALHGFKKDKRVCGEDTSLEKILNDLRSFKSCVGDRLFLEDFLRKKDNCMDEALHHGFKKYKRVCTGEDTSLEKTLNDLRSSNSSCMKDIGNLMKTIGSFSSIRSMFSNIMSLYCHPKRIYVLERRDTMMSLVIREVFDVELKSKEIVRLTRFVVGCLRLISKLIENGAVKMLTMELEMLKFEIGSLDRSVRACEEAVRNGQSVLHEKIMEILSNV